MQDGDKGDWVVFDGDIEYDNVELEKSLSKTDVIVDTRVIKALDMRIAGMSWMLIAEELEVPAMTTLVEQVKGVLSRCIVDDVEEYRTVESLRLDKLWGVAYPLAIGGGVDGRPDWNAFDRCLRVSSQRRELLGLDVPKRSIVNAQVEIKHSAREYSDAELIDIIDKGSIYGDTDNKSSDDTDNLLLSKEIE